MYIDGDTYPGFMPPPPGVMPDLDNPPDAGCRANIAILVVCDTLTTLLFSARMYLKIHSRSRVLLEDVTCALSWICIILYSATVFQMIRYGEGHHSWDVSPSDYSQMLKWLYASSIIYCPAAFFTKATLLLLIARVFAIRRCVSWSIYGFIIGLLIAYIPIQTIKIIICLPIHSYWNPNQEGFCFPQRKVFLADLSLAVFTDVVILTVPAILAWNLHFGWRKQLKIAFLLGAGGLATGVTVWRTVEAVIFMESDDVASDFVLLDILTISELTIGLICACLPSINLLLDCYTRRHRRPYPTPENPPTRVKRIQTIKTYRRFPRLALSTKQSCSTPGNSVSTGKRPSTTTTIETLHPAECMTTTPATDFLHNQRERFDMERANSDDGRREGWLRDPSNEDSGESGSGSSNGRDISVELSSVSGNRPWTRIWDGRSNI